MKKIVKKILSGLISISLLLSMVSIPVFAEDTLPTDELLLNITFDEPGTGTGSFTATKGGTILEHGSVSYTDNYDGSSKALSITADNANNYLELPKGILSGKEAATFTFWIKPGSRWPFMTTPVNGSQTYLYEKYLGMLASPSAFTAERYNNSGLRLSSVTANGTYTDWKYVTVVYASNGTKIYVNGTLAASDTAAVDIKSVMTADATTWIGHANWEGGEGFSGMIDDFRIYGKALNEDEIAALSAKAIELEQKKIIKDKNCLEIDTQFYSNDEISYDESGKDINVTIPSNNEKTVSVIGAAYKDGVLSNVVFEKKDLSIGVNTCTLQTMKKNDNDTAKVFVWDSFDGIKPIPDIKDCKVFQLTPDSTVTIKTTVTNYLPTERTIAFTVIGFDKDGTATNIPVLSNEKTLNVMANCEFTVNVTANPDISHYTVKIQDITDILNPAIYDAGYLPVARVSFPDATTADSASTTEGAHDPTIFKDPVSKKYYAYSSHNLIFESDDLIDWKKYDYTSDTTSDAAPANAKPSSANNTGIAVTVPKKAYDFIKTNYPGTTPNGTYWAPDILYMENDEYPYWFYLSVSCGLGGRNSVISLVKAKSPGLWDGETLDCGVVLASKEENGYNTNAIDANIFTDSDGKSYFIWGSFWRGIHAAELDTTTGLVKGVNYTSDTDILNSCKSFGTRIYSTPAGVAGPEAPYTIYNKDTGYRYIFTSYGWLGTNYNIRVARTDKTLSEVLSGTNPHKQFLDQKNRPVGATYADQVKEGGTLDELWGYKMSGSFQLGDGIEYLGSGHNSVFQDDDGQWYLVQHCRKVADAVAFLQVKKILWTEEGWPVISPLVYAGEKEQTIPKEMLYGTWDLSSVGQTILKDGITDVSKCTSRDFDLPVHSSEIILQADGTLGNNLGTWEYDNDHTVTITFEMDGDNDNYEFFQSGDVMKLFVLTGYDKDKRESAIVMTGTDQNSIASFAKKNNAVAQSAKHINHVDTTPVTIEKSSGGNPILGFDADGNIMYAGDPAALVDGDTVYLYAGHDTSTSEGYVMPEWVCYSSKDMENWKYEDVIMKSTDISWRNTNTDAWASQVIKHGSKYYLYYCTWDKTSEGKHSIGVAVSDSPTGPFTDKGEPLVKGTLTEPQTSDWNDIDPTVWVETVNGEEHRYLAWGNGIFYVCELNEDMVSVRDLNGDGLIKMNDDIKQQEFNNLPDGLGFTEAPWIYRQKDNNGNYTGKYYLFAAFGWREQMGYATSDSIYGPWEYRGTLMPPTATSNTNHPSVIDFKGKTYFIYHNGSLPWGSGFRRSVCVEEFTFNEDGSISPIQETSTGLTGTSSIIALSTDNNIIYHDNFVNPSDDSGYPIKMPVYAGAYSTDDSNAHWEILPGKLDPENKNYVSIQAVNKPGLYICADGTNVAMTAQNTNAQSLARKMTFKTVKGINSDIDSISFESVAKPGYFLTAEDGKLTLSDGTNPDNCSFKISHSD